MVSTAMRLVTLAARKSDPLKGRSNKAQCNAPGKRYPHITDPNGVDFACFQRRSTHRPLQGQLPQTGRFRGRCLRLLY